MMFIFEVKVFFVTYFVDIQKFGIFCFKGLLLGNFGYCKGLYIFKFEDSQEVIVGDGVG